jgi:hypothetical protein
MIDESETVYALNQWRAIVESMAKAISSPEPAVEVKWIS